MSGGPALKRRDLYSGGYVDGRPAANGPLGRFRRQVESVLTSRSERHEAQVEAELRACSSLTRPNVLALISPTGGVGKTTCAFLLGNLLATHLKLRVVAVDANPAFGTLGRLPGDKVRSDRSLADLLTDLDELNTAADLRPYVSLLPSGLHVLAAPQAGQAAADLGPRGYGDLLAFLSCFYDVVLLDAGGVTGPLARFAIRRADQLVLVTIPEWASAIVVLDAVAHLDHERTSVVLNKTRARPYCEAPMLDATRARKHLPGLVSIPYDEQLSAMLDTATYTLEALKGATRRPVKELGLTVARQLV